MTLRQLAKRGYRWWLFRRAAAAVAELGASGDPDVVRIGEALRCTIEGDFSSEERRQFGLIERLRRDVEASREEISYLDYGAGQPELDLDPAAMEAGRQVHGVVGELSRSGSKTHPWTTLLYALTRQFRPETSIELGTAFGFTGAYVAAAARANGHGRLITLEGAPEVAAFATRHFAALGLDNTDVIVGRFSHTLPGVLAAAAPVDLLFVDGRLDGPSYLAQLRAVAPSMRRPALAIFSSITWSASLREAWALIAAEPTVRVAFDLGRFGICVVDGGPGERARFRIPLV